MLRFLVHSGVVSFVLCVYVLHKGVLSTSFGPGTVLGAGVTVLSDSYDSYCQET